jgi:hypothetical protein
MKTTFLTLLLSAFLSVAQAAEHVIYIQNEQVSLRCPASWVIIGHKPQGSPSDMVAFQILNPADDGTDDSTNLSVVAFDVRGTEGMLKFTQSLTEHEEKKHPSKEVGEWAIYTWSGKQGATNYEIRDCYRTMKPFGIHVRLAVPKIAKTTKEWTDKLDADFKKLLESITVKEAK